MAAKPGPASSSRLFSLPNVLTFGRIIAIPALVACFFVKGDWGRWAAMWIFIAAGVSDFLDGYLARAWQQQSKIGRMLDPVADKLIVSAALMMLAADGTIAGWSLWAGVIIICREILVSVLREFLGTLAVSMPVTKLTKWKTVLQMLAIGFLLAGSAGGFIKPGRYLDYIDWDGKAYFSQEDGNVIKGVPHNRFLVTVLQAMGLSPTDYERDGKPGYGSTSTSGRDGNAWPVDYDMASVGQILPGIQG